METNDSPEIPDRGETSDIPGLPSGADDRDKDGNSERINEWAKDKTKNEGRKEGKRKQDT